MGTNAAPPDLEACPRACGGSLWLAWLVLLGFVVVAGAGVSYLPTNDGPRHLFAIHASAELEDVTTGWSDYFARETPITSRGFAAVFGPLDRWLPWQSALRVSLAVMLVLWAGGALAFVRALHPERAWLGLLLSAAAFQWILYMGFFSFYIATALGLWILAVALGPVARRPLGALLLAALLLVQSMLHVAAAAVSGLVVAFVLVGGAARGVRLEQSLRVALIGLPAGLVGLAVLVLGGGAAPELSSGGDSTPWWVFGRCFLGGPDWRAWPLTLLALVGLGLGPLSSRPPDRALWLAGLMLTLLYWILPLHLPSWHFVSVRLLPTAACVLVALLPVERLGRTGRRIAVPGAALVFALASTGWAYGYNRDLAARSADALSGLELELTRRGPRLPVNLDPALGSPPSARGAMPYAVPLANLGHLYALEQGGTVPHNFAVNPVQHDLRFHPDAYDRYPPIPPDLYAWAHRVHDPGSGPGLRPAIVTDAARYGAFYEDVVFWGEPADIDLLAHRGYEIDFRQGGLALARFRGCPLQLEIQDPPPLDPDASLEVGMYPLHAAARRVHLGDRARAGEGRLLLDLTRVPCGAIWLRVVQGGPGVRQAAFRCEGADAQARLLVPSVSDTPRVHCRVLAAAARIATSP